LLNSSFPLAARAWLCLSFFLHFFHLSCWFLLSFFQFSFFSLTRIISLFFLNFLAAATGEIDGEGGAVMWAAETR
jgi:hypothetical protein